MENFTLMGAASYIAPRHLRTNRDTGNRLVAEVDPHDSVGLLDQFSFDARFFTEIERIEFSEGCNDLHTEVSRQILAGHGIDNARLSIELTHQIQITPITEADELAHPFLKKMGE